jgi:hypothetical protein
MSDTAIRQQRQATEMIVSSQSYRQRVVFERSAELSSRLY